MSAPGAELNLVFNSPASDRLICESWWKGVNRDPPDLSNVRQAKPRLMALCILFLLAKYQKFQPSSPDGVLIFQVATKKGTWIGTLANDIDEVLDWIKRRFFIQNSDLFLFASPGAAYNKNGKEPPIVEFYPKKLPITNLNLLIQDSPDTPPRAIEGEELLQFAFKIESKHWKKSAIKELYPEKFSEHGVAAKSPATKPPASNGDASDALFLACMAELPDKTEANDSFDWKRHFDFIFRVLMEKEFDRYREICKPFFLYVGNTVYSAKLPFLWQPYAWNEKQIELLRMNCLYYAHCSHNLVERRLNLRVWREVERAHDMVESVFSLFNSLASFAGIRTHVRCEKDRPLYEEWMGDGIMIERLGVFDDSSPLILAEARECIRRLETGFASRNPAVEAGTYFAQQIILIDFLSEVCLPYFDPTSSDHDIKQNLPQIVFLLKREALENRDMIDHVCTTKSDFLEAAQVGRELLKAQAIFWSQLHRHLLAEER